MRPIGKERGDAERSREYRRVIVGVDCQEGDLVDLGTEHPDLSTTGGEGEAAVAGRQVGAVGVERAAVGTLEAAQGVKARFSLPTSAVLPEMPRRLPPPHSSFCRRSLPRLNEQIASSPDVCFPYEGEGREFDFNL